jgi:hypothetical protein
MSVIVEDIAELEQIAEGTIEEGDAAETSVEERGMVLLEVIQAAVAIAIDNGLTPDVKELRVIFNEDGSVQVVGVDMQDVEAESSIGIEEIVEVLDI